MLVKELEKHMDNDDYNYDSRTADGVTCIVDVMANTRRVRTKNLSMFSELCELCENFTNVIYKTAHTPQRTDLVMDSYKSDSIKDSERQRRIKVRPIELASIDE